MERSDFEQGMEYGKQARDGRFHKGRKSVTKFTGSQLFTKRRDEFKRAAFKAEVKRLVVKMMRNRKRSQALAAMAKRRRVNG